jgi:pimeloyl-ACP methyl ester carboxylesterase
MRSIYKSAEGERAVRERYLEILKYWPVANQQLRVPTREGETFIVACGEENAPPLLLLHGAMANSAIWMGDAAAWAQHFRIYAVDLIGEAGLSAPSRPKFASEAHALWLDDVLQALALSRASMLGVSLGGWLALDYATRRPEHVESVVAICPAGVGRQKLSIAIQDYRAAAVWPMGQAQGGRLGAGARSVESVAGRSILHEVHRFDS